MKTGAEDIQALSEAGDTLSREVMERAAELRQKTVHAANTTREKYESVKVRSDKAIEDSKAVDKINALTDSIMAISSQTSLLALNASIEAARAVQGMRTNLRRMVASIDEASTRINGNVDQLEDVTNVVNSMCTDNSATTEELAAGMQ